MARISTALLIVLLSAGHGYSQLLRPALTSRTFTNGLRAAVVYFPGSTNVSTFTFLSLGLASDGPGQTQWAHLIEHLVLRTTMPTTSAEANAETLPDHLRLDFYGDAGNWKEGLSHQRRWLEGIPFTEASLQAEKPLVNQECDFTVRKFATHKFAVAAWNQGFRHARTNIAVKGDVTKATLGEIQRIRDERLAVSNQVTVCVVGGIPAENVFVEIEKQLSRVELRGSLAPQTGRNARTLDLTWDLPARHLLLTWPIAGSDESDHAALSAAAMCLNMQLSRDTELARDVSMPFVGADLVTPEGTFFYVSAALRPMARFEDLRTRLQARVEGFSSNATELAQVPSIGRQLAKSLVEIGDPKLIKAQAPPQMTLAMIEANIGLQAGMGEHRYGNRRAALAKQLTELSADDVRAVARKYLSTSKVSVCTLRPASSP
jgi:hypothetical protein